MQLKPILGPVQLVFYSLGVIVGAGVYSIIGAAAGLAQQSLWLSFLIGALVALLTAFAYAEMSTAFPSAGAEYIYLRHALPKSDWAALGVGIVILLGGAASATTVAVAFAGYLKVFVDVPTGLSAFALLAACLAFNIWGLQESSWANMAFTAIEVAGLVLVIAAGLTLETYAAPLAAPPSAGVMPAAAILFFVYLGFEEVANLAEEVRDPARDIPKALFWSLGITTVLYVMVALAVVGLATPAELATSQAPLAMAVQRVWPQLTGVLSGIALFATANTVLITLIASTRLAFAMGRDGHLPEVFARILPTRRTPWIAAILAFAMAAVLLPIGDLKILAELSSFAALLAFLAVNAAVILLRYRMPQHARPFRVPLTVGRMPILPLAAILSIGVLLLYFDWQIYVGGAVALVLTVVWLVVQKGWSWFTLRQSG